MYYICILFVQYDMYNLNLIQPSGCNSDMLILINKPLNNSVKFRDYLLHNLVKRLTDNNECLNMTICPLNAMCINTDGSYTCECNDGYSFPDGSTDVCSGNEYLIVSIICTLLQYNSFSLILCNYLFCIG